MTTSCDCPGKNCKKQIWTDGEELPVIFSEPPSSPDVEAEQVVKPDDIMEGEDVGGSQEVITDDAADGGSQEVVTVDAADGGSQEVSTVDVAHGSQSPELIIVDDDDDAGIHEKDFRLPLPPRKRRMLFGSMGSFLTTVMTASLLKPATAETALSQPGKAASPEPVTDIGETPGNPKIAAGDSSLAGAVIDSVLSVATSLSEPAGIRRVNTDLNDVLSRHPEMPPVQPTRPLSRSDHLLNTLEQVESVARSLREARDTYNILTDLLAGKIRKINFLSEDLADMSIALKVLVTLNRMFSLANMELEYVMADEPAARARYA
jgi:hypothetical protein